MNFGQAIEALQCGNLVQRQGWNGKGMHLGVQLPKPGDSMTLPFIWMLTADGNKVPWLASQTDMLSEDWQYTASEAETPATTSSVGSAIREALYHLKEAKRLGEGGHIEMHDQCTKAREILAALIGGEA